MKEATIWRRIERAFGSILFRTGRPRVGLILAAASLAALAAFGQTGEGNPPKNAVFRDASRSPEERARNLLGYMTLEEKVGQMTQPDRSYLRSTDDIATYGLGSVLSGGGSAPSVNTPAAWADMVDAYQKAALKSRLGIPLLYGIDAVHGNNNVRGAVIFPHNIGLGATGDADLVSLAERTAAEETAACGIRWTFAPCVAVPQDIRWGRTYEGFSEDANLTSALAAAAVRGFQGGPSYSAAGGSILATAKHYLADGGTAGGVDQGDARVDEATLRAVHLAPYRAAVAAGAGSVMASFSSWNGVKVHQNGYLLSDVLKGELGFKGFTVSDWAGIKQLPGTPQQQIAKAISAGIDMAMVPDDYPVFIANLVGLVQRGTVSRARIDDAVFRILRAKFALGLFERPLADRGLLASVGSAEHRAVARDAVRRSVVLLKNADLLPLRKSGVRIVIAGQGADDIGMQCGGWTIDWQGRKGDITPGTSLLEAVRKAVGNRASVSYSADGTGAKGADVAILCAGEKPYAEGLGDDPKPSFPASDSAVLNRLRQAGVPVVTVLYSGRPLVLGDAIEKSAAFVAAWLPGTEADGIADVLFGDYPPTGKLPYTWPSSVASIPVRAKTAGAPGALFPFGYGLSY